MSTAAAYNAIFNGNIVFNLQSELNLSDNYLLRKKIGYNAYETIKKDFSLSNISKRYLNIFNHLSQ